MSANNHLTFTSTSHDNKMVYTTQSSAKGHGGLSQLSIDPSQALQNRSAQKSRSSSPIEIIESDNSTLTPAQKRSRSGDVSPSQPHLKRLRAQGPRKIPSSTSLQSAGSQVLLDDTERALVCNSNEGELSLVKRKLYELKDDRDGLRVDNANLQRRLKAAEQQAALDKEAAKGDLEDAEMRYKLLKSQLERYKASGKLFLPV